MPSSRTARAAVAALVVAGVTGAATVAGVTGAASVASATSEPDGRLSGGERRLVRDATKHFRDVDAAIAAGYRPTQECAAVPGVGGMGYHFVNPVLASDMGVDPARPEVLLYERTDDGRLRLAGVEYLKVDADGDPATTDDRPALFERHPFDGPMPGHGPGMPLHYDLHVWLYEHNPSGELSAWNPRVACPEG